MSKRYEEKQKAGELHSEFQRLEDQSKKKVEREQEGGEQQGQETTDGAKEDEDENVTENGEVWSFPVHFRRKKVAKIKANHLLLFKTGWVYGNHAADVDLRHSCENSASMI